MQIMAMFTAMSRARFCKNFLGSLFFGDTVYKNINKKKKNKLAKLIAKDGVFSSAIIIRIFIAISLVTFCPTAKAAEDGLSLIRDCEIEDFLYQITIPLIKAANLNPSDIKIYIVNDSSLNAFVSGGQNIFINTGLIIKYPSPDVLIGVIAHETGHIAAGHLARNSEDIKKAENQMIASYIAGIVAAVTVNPNAGIAMIMGGSQIAERSMLKFSRQQEEAADFLALKYLAKTNNSADGLLKLLQFFNSEEDLYGQIIDEYALTHPVSKKRISFIKSNSGTLVHKNNPELEKKLARIIVKLEAFLGDPDQIIKIYNQNDQNSQYARSIAYYKKGDLAKSLAIIDKLIKKNVNDGYLYDLKGQFLFESGKIMDSISAYNQAIKINPNNNLARIALATSIINLNTKDDQLIAFAINNLMIALKTERTNQEIYQKLSFAYMQNNDLGNSYLALAELNLLKKDKEKTLKYIKLAKENLAKSDKFSLLRLEDIEEFVKKIEKK